jgi:hypothetical protein
MADLKRLIDSRQLKTDYLGQVARDKKPTVTLKFDRLFDALIVLFVVDDQEIVAHYVDDHVALLYLPESLEIVGLQIEDFEHSFLPAHEQLRRVWRLSETGVKVENVGDLILAIEQFKLKLAREVISAAEALLGQPGAELAAALIL